MLISTKAKIASILSGLMLALAGGPASSVTFSHPPDQPTRCSAITIATSGAISCSMSLFGRYTIPSPLGPCAGLAIDAAGTVSCATTLPQGCILTPSSTTPAPGDTITLTASGCTQNPTAYSWTGSGLAANSTTQNTTTAILPLSASAGPYPYSVIASNATGAGLTVGATVNVTVAGYKGPFAYIAHQLNAAPAPGTLSVVDTTNTAASAVQVDVGVYPVGVAVSPAGTRVYVTNFGSGTVSVIDTATNQIVPVNETLTNNAGIVVGLGPYGIAVNPSGAKVYVANSISNSVSVIDAVSNTAIKVVSVGSQPYGVAVSPAGSKVYVTNYAGNSVSVINTANDSVEYLVAINGLPFNKPYGIAVNPAGTRVYVANEGAGTVSVINAANDTVLNTVNVGNSPRGLAVSPDGTKVYVVNSGDRTVSVIDATSGAYLVTALEGMGELANFIAFNPAGTLAYVTNQGASRPGDLAAIDVATDLAPSAAPVGSGLHSFGNFVGPAIQSVAQAGPTVIEFYNTTLDHYFITANSSEAAAIDGGSAGPGWSRTGNSFRSGGRTSVCRFYGSQSPGPNSHFYTVDASECAGLQQLQANTPATEKRWNFESMDFVSTVPSNGTCPAGTTPVYRAYNNGFARGVDSNHRITSSATAIQEVVTRGWSNEGVVMCAPN